MRSMLHKTFPVEIKAAGDAGEFTALVSAFGNVDLVGDRVLKGAFSKTLRKFRDAEKPIPIVLSHQWDDVMAHIGKADPALAEQTDAGLVLSGQLDISDNPVAKQTYKLMKERRLTGFSFGYTVPDGGQEKKNGANEISEIDLIEAGPTLKGANPEAQLQAVKSALDSPEAASWLMTRNEAKAMMAEAVAEQAELKPTAPLPDDSERLETAAWIRLMAERIDSEDVRDRVGVSDELRAKAEQLAPLPDEKAAWDTAYINNLPDSAFLYVAPGGQKDADGKTTPRSLRYFPYRDSSGAVDLPHLRNALARIPQSSLSQAVKDQATARARRLLSSATSSIEPGESEDRPDEEPATSKANSGRQDPLADETDRWLLELHGG